MNIPEAPFNHNSPPSSQVTSYVFANRANQNLKVFVEAAQVVNRPKIVRRLRSGGATICDQVAEAEIILVDPETDSGSQLIRDWSAEKAVLDSIWVQKSIERGRAYLADEGWGGFTATAVGNGFTEGSRSGPVQNHLPTPRETPLEQKAPLDEQVMQNRHPLNPGSAPYTVGITPRPPGTPFQQQMSPQMPNGQSIPGTPVLQNYPGSHVTLPAHLVAQMFAFMNQQQAMSPPNMGMSQMPPMPSQMPLNMLQGQVFPSAFPQQSIPYMSPPGMAPFQHPQQAGAFSSQMPSVSFTEAGSSTHASQRHPSADVAQRNGSISDSRGSPMDVADEDAVPSPKRRKRPADTSPAESSHRKSKSREDRRSPKHRRMSQPYDEPALPFAEPSPPTQLQRGASDSSGKLFVKDSGSPYLFFVQVDIRNRSRIADAIKKNGGRMEPNISDADFVILGHPTTKNFEEWLRQSGCFGKVPVKPQWVLQCVEHNRILELDDFVYEGFKVEKKRGRPASTGLRYIVTATGLKEEEEGSDPDADLEDEEHEDNGVSKKSMKEIAVKKLKEEKVKSEKAKKKALSKSATGDDAAKSKSKTNRSVKAQPQARSPSPKGHWEPSPPPPTRVVEHTSGKNLYTKEDLDYCDEYIPILLARDPKMSVVAICEKLHAKMPHHTFKSWQTHIQSTPARREKLARWRRRAEIVGRKGDAGRSSSEDTGQAAAPQPPAATTHQAAPTIATDPFAIMTDFFLNGRADNLADSEVWAVMAHEFPVLTAKGWEAYWTQHGEAIAQEVSHQNALQGDSSTGVSGDGLKTEPQ